MGRLEGKVAAVTGASGSKRHNGRCDLPNAVYIERSAARAVAIGVGFLAIVSYRWRRTRPLRGKSATCQ